MKEQASPSRTNAGLVQTPFGPVQPFPPAETPRTVSKQLVNCDEGFGFAGQGGQRGPASVANFSGPAGGTGDGYELA